MIIIIYSLILVLHKIENVETKPLLLIKFIALFVLKTDSITLETIYFKNSKS